MSSDIAIKVENLSKCYQIYEQPRDRLKQFILPHLQRALGQEPNHYYQEFWALKDISFEVKKGETIGIIGRNGSGKSTLLQILCGTLNPTSGSFTTNGRIAALLELGSGFNPEFTGRENVYMNAAVLGLRTEEVDQRFNDIVTFADIGQFIEQPVKTYSSGMMVRLAFAVIAHVDADILVIDEALAVGDAFFTQKCMRFLRKFMETGSVLFVSHDTSAVLNLCNRAILLSLGEVIQINTPQKVIEKYLVDFYESFQKTDTNDDSIYHQYTTLTVLYFLNQILCMLPFWKCILQ
ncbi:MAG: ABC transporter ATP-binding protein, partial [Gammaproteobacteria bacterium]|nr:ABC transporter ATP-binding protein [Gammaproteobacteria bacterium]